MNISIILIVAIGLHVFTISSNSLTGNNAQFSFNINVQSPQATQAIEPQEKTPDNILHSIYNLEWQKIIAQHWSNYRVPLLASTLVSGYGYLWYKLFRARKLLSNPESWGSWKIHIEYDRLAHCSHDELGRELLLDIQERYINNVNPTDFVQPLTFFLSAIEKEKQELECYLWWAEKIITSHVQWLFPVNKHSIDTANQALHRLKFIKNLFVTWWVQHNTENNLYK